MRREREREELVRKRKCVIKEDSPIRAYIESTTYAWNLLEELQNF